MSDRIDAAIEILLEVLAPFAEEAVKAKWPTDWMAQIGKTESEAPIDWELYDLLRLINSKWNLVFTFEIRSQSRAEAQSNIIELLRLRNVYSHPSTNRRLTPRDVARFLDNAEMFCRAAKKTSAADLLAQHYYEHIKLLGNSFERSAIPRAAGSDAVAKSTRDPFSMSKDADYSKQVSSEYAMQVFEWYRENWQSLTTIIRKYYANSGAAEWPVVTRPDWLPKYPIPLHEFDQQLTRNWVPNEPEPPPPELKELGGQTYSAFIRRVASEVRLDDNFCYRLIDARWEDNNLSVKFSPSRYFQFVNSCQALGYEFAEWCFRNDKNLEGARLSTDGSDLIARGPAESIFDFGIRSACPATSTLLLLLNTPKGDFFYLHERTGRLLMDSPGGWHVVPSGQFQPDSAENVNHDRDFSLTRTMMRELAEELLGVNEVSEAIRTYDDFYDHPKLEPFVRGLRSRALRPYFLGLGLDPLSTKPGFYIALIMDAAQLPAGALTFIDNWEGKFLAVPLNEFKTWSVDKRMIPDGAMCLRLTLQHLDVLLGPKKEALRVDS